jgi:hypothetical protein
MKHLVTGVLAAAALLLGPAFAAGPADPDPAMNSPDQTAWQLFIAVNTTASGSNATFETWASDTDTFRPNPTFPTGVRALTLHPPALVIAERQALQKAGQLIPQIPPGAPTELEESRRNQPAFDFIVKNGLYSVSGLKKSFGKQLAFPVDAIEVKGNWMPVADVPKWTLGRVAAADVPKVFHVNTGSDGKQYALVAMHVISKLVPNWTWATFENQYNPARCDILGCHDAFGAATPDVAPNAKPEQGYPPCAKSPALAALIAAAKLDTAFGNYCLKGSQTDFTDNTGLAIRLGNSVTENGFVASSSCITCHGRAAWDAKGAPTPHAGFVSIKPLTGPTGPLQPSWFWTFAGSPPIHQGDPSLKRQMTSADFVWSIPFCAYDDSNPVRPMPSPCAGK